MKSNRSNKTVKSPVKNEIKTVVVSEESTKKVPTYEADISFDPYASNVTTANSVTNTTPSSNFLKFTPTNQMNSPSTQVEVIDLLGSDRTPRSKQSSLFGGLQPNINSSSNNSNTNTTSNTNLTNKQNSNNGNISNTSRTNSNSNDKKVNSNTNTNANTNANSKANTNANSKANTNANSKANINANTNDNSKANSKANSNANINAHSDTNSNTNATTNSPSKIATNNITPHHTQKDSFSLSFDLALSRVEERDNAVINFFQNSIRKLDQIKYQCEQASILNNVYPIPIPLKKTENKNQNTKKVANPKDYPMINKMEIFNGVRDSHDNRIKKLNSFFKVIKDNFDEITDLVGRSEESNRAAKSGKKLINFLVRDLEKEKTTEEHYEEEQGLKAKAKLDKEDRRNKLQYSHNNQDMGKIKKELGMDDVQTETERKIKDSEDRLNTIRQRVYEINRISMTTINESDERMVNESCEFSETSIQENPHYYHFKSSYDKRTTNEKDRVSWTKPPFEKSTSMVKKDLSIVFNDELLGNNDNTYVEFENGNNPSNLNNHNSHNVSNIHYNLNESRIKSPKKKPSDKEILLGASCIMNR